MAILSRVKISPQQRYDLEDLFADQAAARTDEKLWTQKFLSEQNLIMSGFTVSGIGLNSATVGMSGASLIVPQNTTDFSYFISAPAEPNVVIPDADLVDGARNYLEVELATQDGTPLTKAFWDPEATSGAGAEFNQIVNTITDLTVNFVVSTGGFSGLANRLPIAIIDVDGSGVIKIILDRREMYGRLAKPNDLDNEYAWGTKVDPVYSLNMSGTVGTFVAGESISVGSATATVVTGGTSSITFTEPTGINFSSGDAVVGATSGATGTINTVSEAFTGVDKSLNGQKKINDALMTEIKKVKNTRFWWEDASVSLSGLEKFVNSIIAPITAGAKVRWDGSALAITDSDGTPASSDLVAKIRIFGGSSQVSLARQDGTAGTTTLAIGDGQVLYVQLPVSGDRTFTGGIGVGTTNYRVVDRASFVPTDYTFWLAYREGSKIFFRGTGELQTNESSEIGDNIPQTLLDNIGFADEVTAASYSSSIRGTAGESLVARLGVLTHAIGDAQEDRSAYLRSDSLVTWTGTQLEFASNIILEIINTKSGVISQHIINIANSPMALSNLESAWVLVDRTQATETLTVFFSNTNAIPAQTQANKDVFVLFRRVDATGVQYLHIPLHKQVFNPGQTARLGASGSGAGSIKATYLDPVSTTLPTGASVTIDGQSGVNGDQVLFTNLSVNNNQIYELSGVGTSIVWTAVRAFDGDFAATDGDSVRILAGDAFKEQLAVFNGTNFLVNDVIRLFDGVSFVEEEYIHSTALLGAQTDTVISALTFAFASIEGLEITYKLKQTTSNNVRIGTIRVVTNGSSVALVDTFTDSADLGITFSAAINGSNIEIRYTSGANGGTLRMGVKKFLT